MSTNARGSAWWVCGLLSLGALSGACVSAGDHEKLKKEAEGTRRDLLRTQREAEKCEADRKALDAKFVALEASAKRAAEERDGKMMERDRRIAERLSQLPQAQEQAKLYGEKIAILETDLAQCRADEANARSLLLGTQQRLTAAEAELATLRPELASKNGRLAQLEAELATLKRDKAEQESQIGDMQAALTDLLKRKQEADARVAEFRTVIAKFQALIDAGKLKVKVVDGRLVVELASDILFASGSASLSADGSKAIREVGQILATIADRKFQVEGHTDNVPMRGGAFPSNWDLGAARAINVVKTMLDAGLAPGRISAASYGDARPAQPNDTAEGKRANRRIEIVLMPDLSQMPGFDELKKAAGGR